MTARDQLADRIALILDPDALDPVEHERARAVAEAVLGMIKPLEWIKGGRDAFMHDADFVDSTNTYQIQEGLFWYAAEINGVRCGTNKAAKAAANRHHRAQILAALGITQETAE